MNILLHGLGILWEFRQSEDGTGGGVPLIFSINFVIEHCELPYAAKTMMGQVCNMNRITPLGIVSKDLHDMQVQWNILSHRN